MGHGLKQSSDPNHFQQLASLLGRTEFPQNATITKLRLALCCIQDGQMDGQAYDRRQTQPK